MQWYRRMPHRGALLVAALGLGAGCVSDSEPGAAQRSLSDQPAVQTDESGSAIVGAEHIVVVVQPGGLEPFAWIAVHETEGTVDAPGYRPIGVDFELVVSGDLRAPAQLFLSSDGSLDGQARVTVLRTDAGEVDGSPAPMTLDGGEYSAVLDRPGHYSVVEVVDV